MKKEKAVSSGVTKLVCWFALLPLLLLVVASAGMAAAIIDIATDASDSSNLADTEPSIAVNPANPKEIAVVSFSEGWSPGNNAPVWHSTDEGLTWTKERQLPQPNSSSSAPGDQKIAYDANGKLYVTELAFGMPSPRLFIFRQTGTSTAALTVGNVYGSSNDDQPHLDIDQFRASSFLGRLYSPWLDFSQTRERATVANSTNSGANLTSVGAGNNGSFTNRTTRMAVGLNGRAYVIYKTREGTTGAASGFENAHFVVNRSDDGGARWDAIGANGVSVHGTATVQTFFTTSFGNSAKGKVGRARSSDAWIAVNPNNGDVYAAYVSRDSSGFGQIFVARSTDGGSHWASKRVTDGTHNSAYPEIAVAATGAVGVLYIDFDDAGTSTIFRHRFARSFNNGSTWSDQILQAMDPGPISNAASGFLWGDYEGLTAVGSMFYGVFTGASMGRTTSQLDPIFFKELATLPDGASIWRYTGTACSGDSCPGWQQWDNNPHTIAIVADGNQLYQLHNGGRIWQSTHTPCNGDSCPGWRMLDNNQKTIAIAAAGGKLYQLHNDGMIWVYTGTACNGENCPGWTRLDKNTKTVAIAAGGNALYQLHNDGMIWRYTGTPCSGDNCPGWQRLDNNIKTTAITAAGNALFQLHNDGMIWRYTGTPCSGNSCPGWQRLDNNTKTTAIVAAGSALYQLHNDGMIWRYTGTPCSGDSCPGWQRLDKNPKTVGIIAAADRLYQMHDDGWIWRYTGTPCSGESCPGWQRLDNNPRTGMLAAGDDLYQIHIDPIYQLHNSGWIWRYIGEECQGNFCPGWERLDNNSQTRSIAAAGPQLFQLHQNGRIWRYTGTPCNGDSCPSWQMLDNNSATVAIAAGGAQLFQLHNNGRIWRYTGTPCSGNSCPNWQMLDNNAATTAIAAGENQLFQLHRDGTIWRYLGTPCNGDSCPGWQMLDNNSATRAIAAGRNNLFQLHSDGSIWRYTGTPCSGAACPGWQKLDNNPATRAIAAGGNQLVQLHNNGRIWRYTGTPCSGQACAGWQMLDNNAATQEIAVTATHIYQRHNTGAIWRFTGPPCTGENCPGWRELDNNAATQHIAVGGFN